MKNLKLFQNVIIYVSNVVIVNFIQNFFIVVIRMYKILMNARKVMFMMCTGIILCKFLMSCESIIVKKKNIYSNVSAMAIAVSLIMYATILYIHVVQLLLLGVKSPLLTPG